MAARKSCILAILSLSSLLVLVLACGGGQTGNGAVAGTETPTTPSTGQPTASVTEAASPSPEQKASPAVTPPGGSPVPTQPSTPVPTAAQGTPAVAPQDQAGFIAQFQGQTVLEEPCVYTPSKRLSDCGSFGNFAVDPPLPGQDIGCAIVIVNNQARAIRCTSQEPLATLYYAIKT